MRIILLFELSPNRAIPFAVGPERYQRLVDELSRYAGVQVQIIRGELRAAPTDTYVLFAGSGDISRSLRDCGPALADQLAPRIVLIDVSWQKAVAQLEEHRLAGAVDSLRLSEWLARPSSCTGLFGLRTLVGPLGASCVPLALLGSTHYCLLQSKHHLGMPHLLADYLTAYSYDQQPLTAVPSLSLTRVLQSPSEKEGQDTRVEAGREVGTSRTPQAETVSVRRAIHALKRAREAAGMTPLQVAESLGLKAEQIDLLETGDYSGATIGTLRAYFLALETTWGWTLADAGEPRYAEPQKTLMRDEAGKMNKPAALRGGAEERREPTNLSGSSALLAETPWILVEGGLTSLGHRNPARRRHEEALVELRQSA